MKRYLVAVLFILSSNEAWGSDWTDCYNDLENARKTASPEMARTILPAQDLSLKLQDTFQRLEFDRLTLYPCRRPTADNNPFCENLDRRIVFLNDQYLQERRQFDQMMQQAGLAPSENHACGYHLRQ